MAKQPPPKPSIPLSTGFTRLLEEPDFAVRIARAEEEILKLLDLCQRDQVTEENRQSSGDVVYAMKRVGDTVAAVATAGRAQIENLEKSKQPR